MMGSGIGNRLPGYVEKLWNKQIRDAYDKRVQEASTKKNRKVGTHTLGIEFKTVE